MLKRRRQEEDNQGSASWLTTYGDMVTLLLTFFVLLFTFSTIEVKKFEAAVSSLQWAFGLPIMMDREPEGPMAEEEEGLEEVDEDPLLNDIKQLLEVEARLNQYVESNLITEIGLEREGRGLVVRFADSVLFDLGRADLRPDARSILGDLAIVLGEIPNDIKVEGHTDDLPINTERFPTNWELSTGRATQVVRYLVESHGLDPMKLTAAGYGEYRPLAPNDTDENRRLNRRVDVVILRLGLSVNPEIREELAW